MRATVWEVCAEGRAAMDSGFGSFDVYRDDSRDAMYYDSEDAHEYESEDAHAYDSELGGMQQLTPAYLASLPQAQQKNILGEQLYKLISATNPSQAGKITGMLLELDTSEVLHLIDTPAALTDKVSEAIEALNAANNAANRAAQ